MSDLTGFNPNPFPPSGVAPSAVGGAPTLMPSGAGNSIHGGGHQPNSQGVTLPNDGNSSRAHDLRARVPANNVRAGAQADHSGIEAVMHFLMKAAQNDLAKAPNFVTEGEEILRRDTTVALAMFFHEKGMQTEDIVLSLRNSPEGSFPPEMMNDLSKYFEEKSLPIDTYLSHYLAIRKEVLLSNLDPGMNEWAKSMEDRPALGSVNKGSFPPPLPEPAIQPAPKT